MQRTKNLRLSKPKQEEKTSKPKSETATTPITIRKSFTEDEYSPIQIRCTQDGGDDELDVVWDCTSPQSRVKRPQNRLRKRPHNISPHVPRKLHTKHNLIPKFSSLRAELEKLSKHNDADENCTEINLDDSVTFNLSPELVENDRTTKESDPFGDDSFDDELIRCSQQVEANIIKPQQKKIEFLLNSTNIADDSFDAILTEFTDDDIARLSQDNEKTPVKNTPRKFYRTNSTPINSPRIEIKNVTPLRSERFPRTKSATDFSNLPSCSTPVKTCSPDEIEKKRQEAKARLELKKFQNEIEKKRLEALEKLKKKKIKTNN